MTVITALDERNGRSFFGRRTAKDRYVLRDIEKDHPHIFASKYTAALFQSQDYASPIPSRIPADAVLFLETEDIPEEADALIVYRWNTIYPFDKDYNPSAHGWKLISSQDMAGYSHGKITKERYIRA